MADVIEFPGKNARKNEGVSAGEEVRLAVTTLPPFGAFGQVGRFSGLHPDGYRFNVWLVQPLQSPSNAILTPGTPL